MCVRLAYQASVFLYPSARACAHVTPCARSAHRGTSRPIALIRIRLPVHPVRRGGCGDQPTSPCETNGAADLKRRLAAPALQCCAAEARRMYVPGVTAPAARCASHSATTGTAPPPCHRRLPQEPPPPRPPPPPPPQPPPPPPSSSSDNVSCAAMLAERWAMRVPCGRAEATPPLCTL